MEKNSYHQSVPNSAEFEADRQKTINRMQGLDRKRALPVLSTLLKDRFEYQWTWLGARVIRLPEDLMVQQEILASRKFDAVIETGIARGGGLIFSASILQLVGNPAPVIGVDNIVHLHAREAIAQSPLSQQIKIIEGGSTDDATLVKVRKLIPAAGGPLLVVLDSDHSPDHVLEELKLYSQLCEHGSVFIVCDTIIDELGAGNFPGRSWNDGVGPLDAVEKFLRGEASWQRSASHGRRGVISGIRDGVLERLPST